MASGFLYSVKAVVDKASFSEGLNEIQKLGATSKKLIAGITGLAAGAVTSASIAGEVATQELKVAKAVGVSSSALSSWKIAANIAGASASGLIGQLVSLESKMQHLKTGTVDSNLAKNLGLMGIGYGDFAGMDSETRMRTVFNQASQMEDQELAATLIGDILGQAGQDYYQSLKMSGKSIDQQLAEAKKLNFVSNQNRKEAALFASEVKSIKEAGKSITMLFGSEMARALTPTVRQIKSYILNNRDQIRKGVQGIAQNIGAVVNLIGGAINKVLPVVTGLIDKFGGLDNIIIKVGVGFASMKLVSVAGGIMSIVKSVNLLKAGLGGIATAGLFLLIDFFKEELTARASGGKTFIWDNLIPAIERLKKELNLDFDVKPITDSLKEMGEAISELFKAFTNSATPGEAFEKTLKGILITVNLLIEGIGAMLTSLTALPNIVKYATGNAAEKAEAGKALTRQYEYLKENKATGWMVDFIEGLSEWKGTKEQNAKILQMVQKEFNAKNEGKKKKEKLEINELSAGTSSWVGRYLESGGSKKELSKYVSGIQDGIIQPSGKITRVAPDDWVFAVKNVADLAGALLPSGVVNNSNSNSAVVNYVINQNLSIPNGANTMMVKQAAYTGTAEALKQNIYNASRIVQQMPGMR